MEQNYKGTVALIYGGRGCESDVSVRGAERIMPLIDREKYRTLSVFIDKDGRWLCNGADAFPAYIDGVCGLLIRGEMTPVSCAVPLLHGDFGEDGVVQGALDNAKIPYIGCGVCAGAVCSDKSLLKKIACSLDIPVVPYLTVTSEKELYDAEEAIGYPMFIKPCRLGSSLGAAKAENRQELCRALRNAFSLDERVLIERYLSHPRELECGYFGVKCKELFTEPGEIVCKSDFYDYENKYLSTDNTEVICGAELDDEIKNRIKDYSARLVRVVGVRNLCRIDFFLAEGKLYFNEINTMPGFTMGSLYPEMLKREGIEPREMINLLIEDRISHG